MKENSMVGQIYAKLFVILWQKKKNEEIFNYLHIQ